MSLGVMASSMIIQLILIRYLMREVVDERLPPPTNEVGSDVHPETSTVKQARITLLREEEPT